MRVIAGALFLGLILSAASLRVSSSPAHACSYTGPVTGYPDVFQAFEYSTVVFTGLVVAETEIREDSEFPEGNVSRVTVRVDRVLKGHHDEAHITFETLRGCGDAGPQLRQGDDVLLSLRWQPSGTIGGQPARHRWMMALYGSTVHFENGSAYSDEPWGEPVRTRLGTSEEFFRTIAVRLQLPESEVNALISEHRDIEGPAGRWTLALQLGGLLTLLVIAGLVVRERRSRQA